MKIYLTRNDVLGIVARHLNLRFVSVINGDDEEEKLVNDELYWEGNEEKANKT